MQDEEPQFFFKSLFVPFTTLKAIHWIVIIGLVVYGNMLFNGFVWDDYPFLLNNLDIRSINIPQLFGKNIFNDASFYRPIPALYNAIIYSMSGYTPFLYYFIQLILHCINASLIFLFFKKYLTKNISFFLSLIFLIHPMQVESVSYISAANNDLFFLFGMSALLISTKAKMQKVDILLVCFLSLLSLLSREMGLAFLCLIVLFQFIFFKKRTVLLLSIESVSLALYILLRFVYAGIFYTKEITRYPIPIAQLPLIQRLENIPAIISYYFSHIIYPANFAVSQRWIITTKTLSNFYLPLLVEILILFLLSVYTIYIYKVNKKRFKVYVFFLLWFLSGLIFILQIVPLELTVADHWIYFPLVGLLGIAGIGLEVIVKKIESKNINTYLIVIAAIILIILAVQTIIRNSNYKDEITLYTHDSAIYDDWELENDIGSDYARIGDIQNAYIHFKRSYDFSPTPWNLYDLGLYYENAGDIKKSITYYSQAYISLKAYKTNLSNQSQQSNIEYNIYLHLANILLLDNNYSSSIEYAKMGLKYYPNASDLWVALAASEYLINNHGEALYAATQAKTLSSSPKSIYIFNQIKNNKPLKVGQ